jgi:NAD(P)-dependent dehydrogenase (short-subunit alcohol dehydrogenase family)
MASLDKKIIAVVGATGKQGGSVARTFLRLPAWHVRCLTRNPSSDAAQTLTALGAEVVQADLDDPSSLSRAFGGANAIFLNTDFFATFRGSLASGASVETSSRLAYDTEVSRGKNAVVAAAMVPTLERFVYSALQSIKKASHGKYHRALHTEAKASIVEYIEHGQPELARRTSLIYLGAYNTNAFVVPQKDPETGGYGFALPLPSNRRVPIVDPTEATGPFVRALVEDEAPGTRLLAYNTSSHLSIADVVDIWASVTGRKMTYTQTTVQALHEKTKVPLEILEGAGYLAEFDYCDGLDGIIEPKQLKAEVQTKSFEQWLREGDLKNTVK